MNAVNHPVSPLGTLRWLLKREYWENRGGFLYAPLIAGLISLVMSTVGIAFGLFALNRAARNGALHVDGESVNVNGLDLALLTRNIDSKDLADLGNGLDLTLVLSSAWPFLVLAFVVFFIAWAPCTTTAATAASCSGSRCRCRTPRPCCPR